MVKQKFPGLNNMTIDEVRVMARVCKNDGCDTEKHWSVSPVSTIVSLFCGVRQ